MLKSSVVSEALLCSKCRSTDITLTDADTPFSFTYSSKRYTCNECERRDQEATLNIEAAKDLQTPQSCYGCKYHGIVNRTEQDRYNRLVTMLQNGSPQTYGPGPNNYGRDRVTAEDVYVNRCCLYNKDLCAVDAAPKPLTRFCFTWEPEQGCR